MSFLGLSLTDPDLRRLLDLASKNVESNNQKHFTFKEIPIDNGHINQFEMMLFERDCDQFNIKVIGLQSYQHIPNLIDLIRKQALNPYIQHLLPRALTDAIIILIVFNLQDLLFFLSVISFF